MRDTIKKIRFTSHGSPFFAKATKGRRAANKGLTLMEATVVMATVALLTALSLPATRTFLTSFATSGGEVKGLISSCLATARAIAAKEQRYAGIRFQHAYHPDGPLKANQYIIFIVQDSDKTGLAYGFRAVDNIKPIKLPQNIGVMDLTFVRGQDRNWQVNPANPVFEYRLDSLVYTDPQKDVWLTEARIITDITTFSVLFSPAGKLVIHGLRVSNKDGISDTKGELGNFSLDDVFNKKIQVDAKFNGAGIYSTPPGAGLFYQDDYFGYVYSPYSPEDFGLGPEPSRNSFIIYDRQQFEQAYLNGQAWSGYLYKLENKMIYMNPYTGTIVNSR